MLCMTLTVGVFPILQFVKAVDNVYKISILSDETLSDSGHSAPCDIAGLSQLYTDAGHTVSLIDRTIFADAAQFNTRVCDVLIIPTGENFPVEAAANFKQFVKAGGRVITLGGYAFSRLLDTEGNEVSPYYVDSAGNKLLGNADWLLGSNEPVYAQDQLGYDKTQLPIFDEEHYYDFGFSMRPAEDQAVFEGDLALTAGGELQGFSAITVTGNYRGRWQPLIYAYDQVGSRIGTVGAIFHIYSTPSNDGYMDLFPTWEDYRATSIAFFGVTSHDLLAQGNENLRQGFVKLVDVLMEDTYIASIDNKYDNYKQGEKPEFNIFVENGSAEGKSGTVELDIVSEDSGEILETLQASYIAGPKSRQTVKLTWNVDTFNDDFYQVNARVLNGSGEVTDRYQTGFSVWFEEVISGGPRYVYEDNYIKILQPNGSYQAVFATGVDDGANLFINEDQTPLVWKQEFIRRQDTGMYIYECLQQYRHAGDFSHLFASPEAMEKHYRSVDNVVYLSQKYGQIYMMGIAIGNSVAANGNNLEKIADDVTHLAQRYATVPGLIYYLNGDLTCHITNQQNKQDFNDFLTERYGSNENLNKAWGSFGLSLGNVDIDMDYINGTAGNPGFIYTGNGWSDVKAYDYNLFRTYLIKRWTSRLIQAVRETGQYDKAVLCEFYSYPAYSVDIPLALGDLTYSNIGFFQVRENFAQTIAYSDQRYQGKGFGIGETGRRTHPAFLDAIPDYRSATYDESRDFFFTGLISTYAMGGNHYQQWCWNDESKYAFPWGMNFTGDKAPRDLYYWFRNTNFVLKQATPVYEVPEVALILPDSTRTSGNHNPQGGHYASIYALDILQKTNVGSILTLNESNLIIDPNIKVIFYPMAYTMPQSVYDTLKAWVEQGGILYISGDFTYDPLYRTRDYAYRLEQLAGVKCDDPELVYYPGLDSAEIGRTDYNNGTIDRVGKPNLELQLAGATALYSDLLGRPVITEFQLGSGTVIYSCDPLEYDSQHSMAECNVALYKQVLDYAQIATDRVQTTAGSVKLFRQALYYGGYFYELLNTNSTAATGTLSTDYHSYQFTTQGGNADYIWEDINGNLIGAFTEGTLYRDDRLLIENNAYAQVTSMDGQDLTKSRQIVVTPQQTGKFALYSDVNWKDMTVRVGQVENGQWVDMGLVQHVNNNGYIIFEVTENMVNAFVVIGFSGFVHSRGADGFGRKITDTLVIGGSRGWTRAEDNGGVTLLYGADLPMNDLPQQDQDIQPPANDPLGQQPEQKVSSQNAFVWVFMGVCVLIVTTIAIAAEQLKKKYKK